MEIVTGFITIIIFLFLAGIAKLIAFWLGVSVIIILIIMLIPGIPYILYVKGANPALGITVFIIEILLVGLILGYNWFNKRRIKKWDKISGKKNKKNSKLGLFKRN